MIWSAPLYRCLNPRWAAEPLSGEGARRFGGRFNRVGLPALYLAETVLGAVNEANQAKPLQPSVLVEYHGAVGPVFDATDAAAVLARGFDPVQLASRSWRIGMKRDGRVPTHLFADALIADGFKGLLVPSYAPTAPPGARNVVFWDWQGLRAIDDEGRLDP